MIVYYNNLITALPKKNGIKKPYVYRGCKYTYDFINKLKNTYFLFNKAFNAGYMGLNYLTIVYPPSPCGTA